MVGGSKMSSTRSHDIAIMTRIAESSFPIGKRILITSVSGLVVKSIVAIDGPRVRFAADAFLLLLPGCLPLF